MRSSTSSSEQGNASLVPLVLVFTAVMLGVYWGVVTAAGWQATFAESNLNAGLLRLQALDRSTGPSAIAMGTSITAKLRPELVFARISAEPLNMGIDGGSTLFAARKVLQSRTSPEIALLEANLILRRAGPNMQTLDKSADSAMFALARYLPVLRRDYRPVTVLYAGLKLLNDKRRSGSGKQAVIDASRIPVEWPGDAGEFLPAEAAMAGQWSEVIQQFQSAGIPVVFVMVPDGNNDRQVEYAFSRKIAARYGLPLLDLKAHFAGSGLVYSDGTHLVRRSAELVSRTLNAVLADNDLPAT